MLTVTNYNQIPVLKFAATDKQKSQQPKTELTKDVFKKDNTDGHLKFISSMFDIAKKENNPADICLYGAEIAQYKIKAGNLDEALECIEPLIKIADEINEQGPMTQDVRNKVSNAKANVYNAVADIYVKQSENFGSNYKYLFFLDKEKANKKLENYKKEYLYRFKALEAISSNSHFYKVREQQGRTDLALVRCYFTLKDLKQREKIFEVRDEVCPYYESKALAKFLIEEFGNKLPIPNSED